MKTDVWEGCYPSKWKGEVVPDAMLHPAKFSSRLIRRIYEHMLDEEWVRRGDTVLDPFGGVALGALDAMRLGLRWRGIELEARFSALGNENIRAWNKRYSRAPRWCKDAVLYNGDSRHLLDVLAGTVDSRRSSPPYADMAHTGGDDQHPERMEGGAMFTPGLAGSVASPPYSEARIGQVSGQEHAGRGDQYGGGATPGQLGAMKAEGFDLAVASPPFLGEQVGGGIAAAMRGDTGYQVTMGMPGKNSGYQNQAFTKGNLAKMPEGDITAAVSSPPYTGDVDVSKNSPSIDRKKQWETYRKSGGGMSFDAFCAQQDRHSVDYGHAEGQLGAMPKGSFDAAITSPPFRQTSGGTPEPKEGGPIDPALLQRHSAGNVGAKAYGDTHGNLHNMPDGDGEDFWTAARQIVEQVYIALAPGAHAVWVVKAFVKNKQIVPFPEQWQQLCEVVGFTTVHRHEATLVHRKGVSHTLDGGTVEHVTESKGFFRRLAEKKGSPRIDFEVVLCMEKPASA